MGLFDRIMPEQIVQLGRANAQYSNASLAPRLHFLQNGNITSR